MNAAVDRPFEGEHRSDTRSNLKVGVQDADTVTVRVRTGYER